MSQDAASSAQASTASTAAQSTSSTGTSASSTVPGTGLTAAQIDSSSSVSSMADLKEKSPEVYNAMMQGVAMKICNEMKSHQDRIKKIMRENRAQTG
jgi:hypothetical protein